MTRRKESFDDGFQPFVVVAIDKNKGSQAALKWTLDNLVQRGDTVYLVHVEDKISQGTNYSEEYVRELFLPFRCFCMRKEVQSQATTLQGQDVAKAIIDFVAQNSVEKLVLGSSSKSSFIRFKSGHNLSGVLKGAPDFCTVFVVSKGKLSSTRKAVRPAPKMSPLVSQVQSQVQNKAVVAPEKTNRTPPTRNVVTRCDSQSLRLLEEKEAIKSPSSRDARSTSMKSYADISMTGSDISFVSSGRPSTDRMFPSLFDDFESTSGSEISFDMIRTPRGSMESDPIRGGLYSSFSNESANSSSWSSSISQLPDEKEAELRRLKLELKQTMDMYSAACKEALAAQQRAGELHRWKMEEQQRLQQARLSEEAAIALAERERAKCRVAMEAAEDARRTAEKNRAWNRKSSGGSLGNETRYRRYNIDEIEAATEFFSLNRKIGEGGYGPVFKCYLDNTPVAVKVLRPDAAQGRSQFHQEVEILSCIRHPNMVLLLGACPEYGCLVYEYMANGSLEDRLFRRGNSPVLSWQLRFRIANEIATGLLFLHQTKPEPLVHRDLKPANILLDRSYTSKISDVGLARLVPPSVADSVTQYRMTCTAGTFCYIDPEYQQTGMLGIKSDIYSLGVMFLQILTGRPPMGLTHHVGDALRSGLVEKILDPAVRNWPVEEASCFAKLALRCAEMRRKDRPDLGSEVLPELNRLRDLADENMYPGILGPSRDPSPIYSHASNSSSQEVLINDAHMMQYEYESPKSRSSASSFSGKRSIS